MARQYTSPILLPSAPSTGLHAATKQYVDDGDTATAAAAAPLVHTHTEADVTSLVSDLAGKQPLDSDLTTIASLTATTDSILQSKASAWTTRTPAQLKTDLAITESDVTGLVTDLAAKQPLDTDLTTIAGLTATTDNIIQSVGSAWASRTPTQVKTALAIAEADVSGLVSDLAGKQPVDSDLTTIAGLTATTGNIIQSVGSAWASQTPTQVKSALAITESDVSGLVTDLAAKQPLDSDLTTIASLTATTDNFMIGTLSAWSSRTPVQAKASLAITEADVTNLTTDLAAKAPLASPTFTGVQTAPRVIQTPYTVTWSSSITLDPTLGNNPNITATAATALAITTTGALDGQMVLCSILASGGTSWVVTLNSSIKLTTGLTAANTITTGKVGFVGLRYSSLLSAWVCIAYTASL